MLLSSGKDRDVIERIAEDDDLVRQPFFWSDPGMKLFGGHADLKDPRKLRLIIDDALAQLTGRAEEWLRAVLWMQAVAHFLAGAALIWAAARVARAIDVPRALQAARVAQVAHAVWHAGASVGVAIFFPRTRCVNAPAISRSFTNVSGTRRFLFFPSFNYARNIVSLIFAAAG